MRLKSSMASKQGSTGNDGDGKRKNRNVETNMEADGQKECKLSFPLFPLGDSVNVCALLYQIPF